MEHPKAWSKRQDNGETVWFPCTVLEYDPELALFSIEWDDDHRRKKVARFNLRFDIEKESKFEARIEAAKMAALRYEMQFRFDTRVQEMPVDDLPDLSPTNLQICFNDQNALGPEGEGDCSGASRGDVQQFQNHEQQVSVGV